MRENVTRFQRLMNPLILAPAILILTKPVIVDGRPDESGGLPPIVVRPWQRSGGAAFRRAADGSGLLKMLRPVSRHGRPCAGIFIVLAAGSF